MKQIPIYSYKGNEDKKVCVGYIEDNCYYTNRDFLKHFFRIFSGYGMSIDVYNQLIENKCLNVKILISLDYYCSDLSQWRKATDWENELNSGKIDNQLIMKIKDMTIINIKEVSNKMAEDIFSKGIGSKESRQSLLAKPIVVQGKLAESVMGKIGTKNAGKEVGKKLSLICKHPDKEETIKISSMVFISGKSVKSSTMWINVDEDGNIQKGSTVALLLEKYQLPNVNALDGKTLQTELDENNFLAIKAY
jgi:hypothetical protein